MNKIGAGDVVKRVTDALGIKPCGGCKERQRWMNEHLPQIPIAAGSQPVAAVRVATPNAVATLGEPFAMEIQGAIVGGTIPPGLRHERGVLAGIPEQAGEFLFTVSSPMHRSTMRVRVF